MVWSGSSHSSSLKANGFSEIYGLTAARVDAAGPWVPALRCAAAGMTVVLAGCVDADPAGDCNSDGGVWDADTQKCFCSRSQEGQSDDEPSTEQTQWRQWCADITNLDSIRNADTPAPAQ